MSKVLQPWLHIWITGVVLRYTHAWSPCCCSYSVTKSCLTVACQAPLSFIICWSLLKFMAIESVMPSNHLILCHPLLLLPSMFPSIRVFPMSQFLESGEQSIGVQLQHQSFQWTPRTDLLLGWTGWISLQSKGLSRVFSNTTVQRHQFFGA